MEVPTIAGKRIESGKEMADKSEGARIEDAAALTELSSFLFSLRTDVVSRETQNGAPPSATLLKRAYNTLLLQPSRRLHAPDLLTVPELLCNAPEQSSALTDLQNDPFTAPWVRTYKIARKLVSHVESCVEVVQQTTRTDVVSFLSQKVTSPMSQETIDAIEIDQTTSAIATIVLLPPGFLQRITTTHLYKELQARTKKLY